MEAPCAVGAVAVDSSETGHSLSGSSSAESRRPQFGTRFLTDPKQVFQHNAWDNVEWTDEQEEAAKRKVSENSYPLPAEKQEEYDSRANEYWNEFYTIHENRFFKDRHWLFTEFPELAPQCSGLNRTSHTDEPQGSISDQNGCRGSGAEDSRDFPGSSASYRILEVGCGVGNTVFPILKTNKYKLTRHFYIYIVFFISCFVKIITYILFPFCSDPGLFVYCCDFSSTAVELVKTNPEYDPGRCFAFVQDLSDAEASYPIPDGSLDVIVLIFVLSALHPDKMQASIRRLARLLKPGGMILLRDYGRYDMAQLRFKKGRCLSENFYVRGDGTRVYFFTQDELHELFTRAELEKVQNLVDRRLQVNRGKQLTMYRVWIQCKYKKAS